MPFKGFYAVYRDVFKTLSAEDYQFMDDKESDFEFPDFGNSQSDYEEVNTFGLMFFGIGILMYNFLHCWE